MEAKTEGVNDHGSKKGETAIMWGTPDISNTKLFSIIGAVLTIPIGFGIFLGWLLFR